MFFSQLWWFLAQIKVCTLLFVCPVSSDIFLQLDILCKKKSLVGVGGRGTHLLLHVCLFLEVRGEGSFPT